MIKKYSRNIFALHSWVGILAGLGVLLLSLTGSILLFQHEIDRMLYEPEVSTVPGHTGAVAYDKALENVRDAYPDWNIRIALQEPQRSHPLLFDLRRPGSKMHVYAHPQTGEILGEQSEKSSLTMIALKLHYSLMAGLTGRIIIAVLGLLFLVSLLTGVYMYRNKIIKVLRFQWKQKSRSGRKKYAHLHNVFGTWSIFFNMGLTVTGLYLSYLVVANGFRIAGQTTLPDPPAVEASLDRALNRIRGQYPELNPSYIKLPVSPGTDVVVYGSLTDDFFLFDRYANRISVDAEQGTVVSASLMRNQPLSRQIAAVMKPLHAGEFGGWPIRLLYLIIGLSVPLLSITGYLINWKRGTKT